MRWAAILAVALHLAAQDSRFDVRSRLVLVPVTVTDANGRSVDDLEASDFAVLDNEGERKVTVDTMTTGVAPIALVIAVQTSGISGPVLEKVRRIGGMIQPLITGERGCAGVVAFDLGVTWLEDCTNNSDALEGALKRLRPGEHKEARMLDAVDGAIERLRNRPNSRRVLLLISESRDRGSETDLDAVTVAAQSADISIYSATYSALKSAFTSKSPISEPGRVQKPKTPSEVMGTTNGAPASKYNGKIMPEEQRVDLRAGIGELARLHKTNTTEVLTGVTGGTTFPFTRQKGLEDAIEKLGGELHSQYVLSFAPEASAAGYHKLEVRVVRAGEFHVRARPGYWLAAEAH